MDYSQDKPRKIFPVKSTSCLALTLVLHGKVEIEVKRDHLCREILIWLIKRIIPGKENSAIYIMQKTQLSQDSQDGSVSRVAEISSEDHIYFENTMNNYS